MAGLTANRINLFNASGLSLPSATVPVRLDLRVAKNSCPTLSAFHLAMPQSDLA
jgi:hypothetical protein